MNNRGNLMINILFFMMGLAVMIMFIAPMKSFIDIANGSNFLNCPGYVDATATAARNYSYDSTVSSSTLACLSLKLYLPYILLVFLVGGLAKVLYDRATDFVGQDQQGAY